ncbi:MAG TPA: L,D-transpeptidase family protein [Longimicrobiaceae bacterium]|nr:L,D-transpeptidase family protein [Longimicrobiaceae bacterium]
MDFRLVRRMSRRGLLAVLPFLLAAVPLRAQAPKQGLVTKQELWEAWLSEWGVDNIDPAPRHPTSRADSLAWVRARDAAMNAKGRRVVLSLFDRHLWLIEGTDTLVSAPAGIGMGVVTVNGRTWDFSTPRGERHVLRKVTDPVWVPPDWEYQGLALARNRKLVHLQRGEEYPLSNGDKLVVRDNQVGLLHPDGTFEPLEGPDTIMYDGTVFVPPLGSKNREAHGLLGDYALKLGDGYMIHGTQEKFAIGLPATHGCIRLAADKLAALYAQTPVGTAVYIY